jgi:uncharacterized protein (TIGR03435 family)
MIKTLAISALMALSLEYGHCQNVADAPAFEVASITPSKPGTPAPPEEHAGMVQFTYPGGRFNARATTLTYLLEWAWGIQPSQHSGGPSWLGTDRYDIAAKAEGNPGDDRMKLMVRTLLAERFQLQLHHESRELSVYVVSLGKTAPKLFPAKEGEVHAIRFGASHQVIGTRFTVTQLIDLFARQLGAVVVDKTGLDGEFDFTVELTPDETRPNPPDPMLLIGALKDQLGLTLKSQRAPTDVLVIDSAAKVTAGN